MRWRLYQEYLPEVPSKRNAVHSNSWADQGVIRRSPIGLDSRRGDEASDGA